ncbi:8337_t:CDS:2 [Funneliformis geosporum]|nr:8337_t:CDS:2 [Funneliformis geosporum]
MEALGRTYNHKSYFRKKNLEHLPKVCGLQDNNEIFRRILENKLGGELCEKHYNELEKPILQDRRA